jgi:hypothetical protein
VIAAQPGSALRNFTDRFLSADMTWLLGRKT